MRYGKCAKCVMSVRHETLLPSRSFRTYRRLFSNNFGLAVQRCFERPLVANDGKGSLGSLMVLDGGPRLRHSVLIGKSN